MMAHVQVASARLLGTRRKLSEASYVSAVDPSAPSVFPHPVPASILTTAMVRVNVVATQINVNETNVTTPTHTPVPAIVGVGVSVGSRRPFLLMASGLGGAPNHVSGVGAAALCCRPALATAALQVHNCGGRSCPRARLMKWPGMSPRLRRTAGHTIAIRDAVVVMSSVQQGRVSASVMQSRRGMVTKNASEHETTTIGVDDDLRRSELLDPLPVSPRPTPPPPSPLPHVPHPLPLPFHRHWFDCQWSLWHSSGDRRSRKA
jgi:hypothetical protein